MPSNVRRTPHRGEPLLYAVGAPHQHRPQPLPTRQRAVDASQPRPAPLPRPEATCLGRSAAGVSYDGAAAAEGPSRPLTPIERDLGRGSPSCQDGDSLNIAAGTHYTIHYIGCTS